MPIFSPLYRDAECPACLGTKRGDQAPWNCPPDVTPEPICGHCHGRGLRQVQAGTRVEWDGLVLATRERNGYHDSDFYAIVYDPEGRGALKEIEYATTRFPSEGRGAREDASERVVALARGVLYRQILAEFRAADASRVARATAEIRKGDDVEVFKGRKVKPGTTGRVIWVGEVDATFSPVYRNGYNRPRSKTRLGIETARGERVFVDAAHCRLVADGHPREVKAASLRELARAAWRATLQSGSWRSPGVNAALARAGWATL